MVRIRSEHAIGFLKGRFHSWVAACVGVHSFAMRSETEEHGDSDEEAVMADPFIQEGLSSSSDSEANAALAPVGVRMHAGKIKREDLKRRLFRAKERRKRHQQRRQQQELGMGSDSGGE
ncbi:hypothetical protein DFH07DRAFT_850927 [Mycena maculata]|uniref:Uncharacterized protein n=1 Tax=Mycena maculata TaxID=230809 RepID=A0AAD7HUH6_9AGAR|nr:hypothetical protein DFH07DRAFT_850927 [Mycena maculata]